MPITANATHIAQSHNYPYSCPEFYKEQEINQFVAVLHTTCLSGGRSAQASEAIVKSLTSCLWKWEEVQGNSGITDQLDRNDGELRHLLERVVLAHAEDEPEPLQQQVYERVEFLAGQMNVLAGSLNEILSKAKYEIYVNGCV